MAFTQKEKIRMKRRGIIVFVVGLFIIGGLMASMMALLEKDRSVARGVAQSQQGGAESNVVPPAPPLRLPSGGKEQIKSRASNLPTFGDQIGSGSITYDDTLSFEDNLKRSAARRQLVGSCKSLCSRHLQFWGIWFLGHRQLIGS